MDHLQLALEHAEADASTLIEGSPNGHGPIPQEL